MQQKMARIVGDFHLPRYDEITNVGLYLEQTVKFINSYLAPLGEPDITSSMVSNYVKQKLVANPGKKQYYTDHIVYLIFIAVAKTVVSLDDIRMLMSLQQEQYSLKKAYDYFCAEFENALFSTFGIAELKKDIGESDTETKDLLRNTIITVVHKIYLDHYLRAFRDSRGTAPDSEQK